jgi:hypothetical protein
MGQDQHRYRLTGICIVFFLVAQTFQELASRFWIPDAHGREQELQVYLLPIDRVRALLILASILTLIVPYTIAMRYWQSTPIAAATGLVACIGLWGSSLPLAAWIFSSSGRTGLASFTADLQRKRR